MVKNHNSGVRPKGGDSGHHIIWSSDWTITPIIAINWLSKCVSNVPNILRFFS